MEEEEAGCYLSGVLAYYGNFPEPGAKHGQMLCCYKEKCGKRK